MHGAALAQEARPKLLEHPIRLEQRAPESIGIFRVIGGVLAVDGERDGASDLAWHIVDRDGDAELAQRRHQPVVEVGDRLRAQRKFGRRLRPVV